jgi:hypothetical protein
MFYPWLIPFHLAFVLAGLSLLLGVIENSGSFLIRLGSSRRNILLVVFFLLATVSWLQVDARISETSFGMLTELMKVVLLYFAIVLALRNEDHIWRFVWTIIILFTINGAISIYMYHIGRLSYRMDSFFQGMASDTNEFSMIMVMLIPVSVALIKKTKYPAGKLLLYFSFLTFLYCISRSLSRGGFLGFAIVLGITLFQNRRSKVLILIVILLTGFMFYKTPMKFWDRMESIINPDLATDTSHEARIRLKKQSLYLISQYPFFGAGIGAFRYTLKKHGIEEEYAVSHDTILGIASETGILNGIIFVLIIVGALKELYESEIRFKRKKKYDLESLSKGLFASLIGYSVCAFFLSLQYHRIFYIILGLSTCLNTLEKDSTKLHGNI